MIVIEDIWILIAAGGEETAPDSVCRGLAGVVEGGLSNRMAAWVEFEDHGIAYGRLDSVWVVDKFAFVTHFDGVLGRQAGSGEKDEKGVEEFEVSHFGIDKVVPVVEYTQLCNVQVYRFWKISSQETMGQFRAIYSACPADKYSNRKRWHGELHKERPRT